MTEIKKVAHKLMSKTRMGAIWHKIFEFDKVRITRNGDGGITSEMPFKETLHLISLGDQALWLKPDQMLELKNLIEDSEC